MGSAVSVLQYVLLLYCQVRMWLQDLVGWGDFFTSNEILFASLFLPPQLFELQNLIGLSDQMTKFVTNPDCIHK
jgi:hypothetical protein